MKEIELKCPKCRFKFVEHFHSGLTELSCVCPRCGTPFAYTLTEQDIDTSLRQSEVAEGGPNGLNEHKDTACGDNISLNNNQQKDSRSNEIKSVHLHSNNSIEQPQNEESRHQSPPYQTIFTQKAQRKSRHSCLGIIIGLAFIAIIVVWVLSKIVERLERKGEPEIVTQIYYTAKGNNAVEKDEKVIDDTVAVDSFKEIHPEVIPEWLNGTWVTETDYGEVFLHIEGNNITERTQKGVSRGTFFYNDGTLYCSFPENTSMTYKVDIHKKIIQQGGAYWFTKRVE